MAKRSVCKYWSGTVTKNSNALDLEKRVFALSDPRRVARSLRRSAERSRRRKGSPYQSAMSMLNFYINRAGRNLTRGQKRTLASAKVELRKLYGKEPSHRRTTSNRRKQATRG